MISNGIVGYSNSLTNVILLQCNMRCKNSDFILNHLIQAIRDHFVEFFFGDYYNFILHYIYPLSEPSQGN